MLANAAAKIGSMLMENLPGFKHKSTLMPVLRQPFSPRLSREGPAMDWCWDADGLEGCLDALYDPLSGSDETETHGMAAASHDRVPRMFRRRASASPISVSHGVETMH